MDRNYLSLHEKWASDVASYQRGAPVKTRAPQCERCLHRIRGDALHCGQYRQEEKPQAVLFARRECPAFSCTDYLDLTPSGPEENRRFGGIFGFITGDMLGVPVEFSHRRERDSDPVAELRAYGTYHQPFGAWSDDTSLMLCLMDSLIGGYSPEGLARNMTDFYQKGLFTPAGTVFDIGNATAMAIRRMMTGLPPADCGGKTEMDNGNGSVMRVLPLAYALDPGAPEKILPLIEEVSACTHGHPRAKLACILYVHLASRLLAGADKAGALEDTLRFVQRFCAAAYEPELAHYRRILTKGILKEDRGRIRSTGYVVDTLEAVIWCFFRTDSYRDAVLTAVNLGEDTDTVAALVGGLAGIYYGCSAIPENWLQSILRKQDIAALTRGFCQWAAAEAST